MIGALENGDIDEVYLAYTVFKNTVTQIPTFDKNSSICRMISRRMHRKRMRKRIKRVLWHR